MKFTSPTLRVTHSAVRGHARIKTSIRRLSSNEAHKDVITSTNLPPPRIDYKSISDNVLLKSRNVLNRKTPLPANTVQSAAQLYAELKSLSSELNHMLARRNHASELVRTTSRDSTAHFAALERAKALKKEIMVLRTRLTALEAELLHAALPIPNDTHPDSPIGPESAAITLATHGPSPLPATASRDHVRIGRALNMLDLEAGSTVTGSSWYYLMNEGALLEIALTNYAVSVAIKHNYRPVITPDVVKADIATRCGFHPRDPAGDVQQMYHLASETGKDHPELVLSGTAEIPLAGLFVQKIFEESRLPQKIVGIGKAFRAEAGARGADTRGLYRVHQFSKVELFAVTTAEDSETLMEDMRKVQVDILTGLGLPLRVLDMPTEELGASAYRKYDIEAWMPGRGRWGEVTSMSNCTDYQSRRLHIRYRPRSSVSGPHSQDSTGHSERQPLPFVHTLNGTAMAIPRLIVALLENGVRFQGSEEVAGLNLPRVLHPFWIGTQGDDTQGIVKINWV